MTVDTPSNNSATAYLKSCGFCHGGLGDGKGLEAATLKVPPEVLVAVRTARPYLKARLLDGMRGSDMPYFTVYTGDQIDGLVDYLDRHCSMLREPDPLPVVPSVSAVAAATRTHGATCAQCHGVDGSGATPAAAGFLPAPPDFRVYSLQPQRTVDVVTGGYLGTAMAPNGTIPEEARWGLVQQVAQFRRN